MTSPAPAKTPSFRLDGGRALITGAGRGIGLAAASALAAAGAQVTLAARTKSEVEQAAAAIRERGEKAEALPLDVTDVEAARRAIAQAGPFQILVNNAGMNRPAYLPDVTVDDFDAIFALNVRAALFMAQAVARRLIEAKLPGSIINISSQMGHVGAARRTVYCASKHAMEGFTKAMAIELAPHSQQPRPDFLGNADDAAILRKQGVPRRSARQDQAWPARPARRDHRRDRVSRLRCFVADDRLGARARRRMDRGVMTQDRVSARPRESGNLAWSHKELDTRLRGNERR